MWQLISQNFSLKRELSYAMKNRSVIDLCQPNLLGSECSNPSGLKHLMFCHSQTSERFHPVFQMVYALNV